MKYCPHCGKELSNGKDWSKSTDVPPPGVKNAKGHTNEDVQYMYWNNFSQWEREYGPKKREPYDDGR